MASRNNQSKRGQPNNSISAEQRRLRRNQIIFAVISILVLASMIISLVAK
jgi:predicted nucleic acid-binding Zn ribbon protein